MGRGASVPQGGEQGGPEVVAGARAESQSSELYGSLSPTVTSGKGPALSRTGSRLALSLVSCLWDPGERKKALEEMIGYYRFCSSCEEFRSWMKDKENIFRTLQPQADNVEVMQQKYQSFLTELAAGKGQLGDIENLAAKYGKISPGKYSEIQIWLEEINSRWERMETLKEEKGSELIGVADVKTFLQDCQSIGVLLQDKMVQLGDLEPGNSPAGLESDKRKLCTVEREVLVIERKIEYLRSVAKSIKDTNPAESRAITEQVETMERLLAKLKLETQKKQDILQRAQNQQSFLQESRRLLLWAEGIREKLSSEEMGVDVASAEQLLKEHQDLLKEIRSQKERFVQLEELGRKVIHEQPSNGRTADVHQSMERLAEENKLLEKMWEQRQKKLQDGLELQKFNREGDRINAALSGHEAFLRGNDLGDHVDAVRSLLKQHQQFEQVLMVLKRRIEALNENGVNLIENRHFASHVIEERMITLRRRWERLIESNSKRKQKLLDSLELQEFNRDAADLLIWMEEKYKIASDESYRDPTNVLRKLKWHEAAEKEMMANEEHFATLINKGNQLIQDNHYAAVSIREKMSELQKKWKELYGKMIERGDKLRQAGQQEQLMELLQDAKKKIEKIEKVLQESETGHDLRSSRDLLKQHRQLENETRELAEKMNSIVSHARKMATNHFDSQRILDETQKYLNRFESLQAPLDERRKLLEASVDLYEFYHYHDMELNWINERLPIAHSTNCGKSLDVAQSLLQKHKELQAEVNAHKQQIQRVLDKGKTMVVGRHPSAQKISEKCQELVTAWQGLEKACEERMKQLQHSVGFQEFLMNTSDLDAWIAEKYPLVTSKDYGKDEDSTLKLRKKHKALEHEIAIYQNLMTELSESAQTLCAGSTQYVEVDAPKEQVHSRLQELQELAAARGKKLDETLVLHEFLREYEDLQDWITQQKQIASSEDYGNDYAHVLQLCAKYDTFRHQLEGAGKRVVVCQQLADSLVNGGHSESREIRQKQKELRNSWEELLEITRLRGERLRDAEVIHKCFQDLTDALAHIEEKSKSIPDDVAKDMRGVQTQLRNHVALEHELSGNEQQLQELIHSADHVLTHCSKKQVEDLKAKQQAIVTNWRALKSKVELRKKLLEQAHKLYQFQAHVWDYFSWTAEIIREMRAKETIRDISTSSLRLTQHQQLLAEIEAREEKYNHVVQEGQSLLQDEETGSKEIQQKLQALLEEKENVYNEWKQKKEWLEKIHQEQMFYKDLDHLDKLLNSQEKGNQLIQDNHYAAVSIREKMSELQKKWKELYGKIIERDDKLRQAGQQEQLMELLQDAKKKIEKIEKVLQESETGHDLRSSRDLLKQHRQLENETRELAEKMNSIVSHARKMATNHFDSQRILDETQKYLNRFESLQAPLDERRKLLEASVDLYEFYHYHDMELNWINERLPIAHSTNCGKSLDVAQSLLQKHKELQAEVNAHKQQIQRVLDKGKTMVVGRHPSAQKISEKCQELVTAWQGLEKACEERMKQLQHSVGFQEFLMNTSDLDAWIAEKYPLVTSKDYGKDEDSTLKLRKKHKALEHEIAIYQNLMTELSESAQTLCAGSTQYVEVDAPKEQVHSRLQELQELAAARGKKLDETLVLHEFLREYEDLQDWITQQKQIASSEDYGNDYAHVLQLCAKYDTFRHQLEGAGKRVVVCQQLADSLVNGGHSESREIRQKQKELRNSWEELLEITRLRGERLRDAEVIHKCFQDLTDALAHIEEKSKSIPDDVAKDMRGVQTQLRNHVALEHELSGNEQQLQELIHSADHVLTHCSKKQVEDLKAKQQAIVTNWRALKSKVELRKKLLEQAHKLYQFQAHVWDYFSWTAEIIREMRAKETIRDISTSSLRLTQHQQLLAEIEAREEKYNHVVQEGQSLLQDEETGSKEIQQKLQALLEEKENVYNEWKQKKEWLEKIHQEQMFYKDLDHLDKLLNSQEIYLKSSDLGSSVDEIEQLIRKHEAFEKLLSSQDEKMMSLQEQASRLEKVGGLDVLKIQHKLNAIRERKQQIKDLSQSRREKLQTALLLALFYQNLEEAENWISERMQKLEDPSVQDPSNLQDKMKLLQKHQVFEAEILANEEIITAVTEKGEALVSKGHPKSGEIRRRVHVLQELWEKLKRAVASRGKMLEDSRDFLEFLQKVDQVEAWIREKEVMINVGDLGNDYEHCLQLVKKLNEFRGATSGEMTVDDAHIRAINALAVKLERQNKEETKTIYERRKQLNEKLDIWKILVMVKIYLKSSDLGSSVDEIEQLIRKHEAFEKLLSSQDEKMMSLQEQASRLEKVGGLDVLKIQHKLNAIRERKQQIKDLSQSRREKLQTALLLALFYQNLEEAENWIGERMQKLEDPSVQDPSNLQDKMKLLQKHQVFEAEILANEEIITAVTEKGEALVSKGHPKSGEIRRRVHVLQELWEKLKRAVASRGKMLEDSRDFLEFLQKVDQVEAWIREKEVMINVGDLGNDYEHCLQLVKKLNEFRGATSGEMTVDDAHIRAINALAVKLERQNKEETKTIYERRKQLNEKWNSFHGNLNAYRKKLEGALEIHALIREIDDITERITEKSALIQALDYGKDVESVENLIRRHEEMEREISVIKSKIEPLQLESFRLSTRNPSINDKLTMKQQEMKNNWLRLQGQAKQRKEKLAASYQLQKFNLEMKEILDWTQNMRGLMEAGGLPKSANEAESMIEEHQERKEEIEARVERFNSLSNYGQGLANSGHYATPEIHQSLSRLQQAWAELIQVWQEQHTKLLQAQDLQKFYGYVEQTESWLSSKEAFLANEDLGDSVSSVESLQRKHAQFEKALEAQMEKIDEMASFARQLTQNKHYDSDNITNRFQAVLRRKEKLLENAAARRHLLEESRLLQKFLRNSFEVAAWINEKNSIAQDDSWKDPSNLQTKLQKHQTFQAEIMANRNRLDSIKSEGEKMLRERHYAPEAIQSRLQEMEELWEELVASCQDKRAKLQDAYKGLHFQRSVEDMEKWLEDVENELKAPYSDNDLVVLNSHLKKQEELEEDIAGHRDRLQELVVTTQQFQKEKHFLADELEERVDQLVQRYKSLRDPLQERRGSLEASRLQYQFFRDVDEELAWVHEKLPMASSRDYGQSLATVQSLQEKHQNLENEISSRDALTKAVLSTGQKLVRGGHSASRKIMEHLKELEASVETLKAEAQERRQRLMQSYEAHLFLNELLEVEAWLAERSFILETSDYGKNEESTQALLRKLEATKLDMDGFRPRIEKVQETGASLINKDSPESPTILAKLQGILADYQSLLQKAETQRKRLQEQFQLYQFEREFQLVDAWLSSKQSVAESDDYGQDLDDVEVLEKKFKDFVNEVKPLGHSKVVSLNELASKLEKEGHSKMDIIQKRTKQINETWEKLCHAIQARTENLTAARQVHQYDHDVDEIKGWMQEKEAVVDIDDYGYDLPGVQTLLSQLEGVERDLGAIMKELERIRGEAWHLSRTYPQVKENIMERLTEVDESWENLDKKFLERKARLSQAEQVQLYFNDCRELMAWANEMHALVISEELANDVLGAELLIKRHEEYKREIEKQWLKYEEMQRAGGDLMKNGHFMSVEIEEKLLELSELMKKVKESWDMRKELYEENWEIQLLRRELEQAEAWLAAKESFLSDPSYGDSVSEVEELLKKHHDFEKMLAAQEEKFAQLSRKTKREMNLLKQVDTEESEQKDRSKVVRVPSLKRKTSDKRNTPPKVTETKSTPPVPPVPLPSLSLRAPLETIFSPVEKSPSTFQQFAAGGVPEALSSNKTEMKAERRLSEILTPPTPKTVGPPATALESRSSLSSPLSPTPTGQPRSSTLSESYATGLLSPQEKSARGSSFFNLQTKVMATPPEPGQMSLDKPPSLLRSDSSSKPLENKSSASASLQHMEGFLEKRDQLLPGRQQPGSRSWKSFYAKLDGLKLDFYNDEKDASKNVPALLSVSIPGAKCERLVNYIRKENAFMLRLRDGAEYFLAAPSQRLLEDWLQSLQNNIGQSNRPHSTTMLQPFTPNRETSQTRLWDFADRDSAERLTTKSSLPRRTPSFKIKPERESAEFSRAFKDDGTAATRASTTPLSQQTGNQTKPLLSLLEARREK
ncbi:PREDICTED: spectrin beta chain, non-erythrocytic 5-like [Calidris pugnax]|uniref:spectrin beta chain, non-erythrocytic 5-like n=1 Tax=Calidris pugnax TaxID=198806 RepID=UPI00071CF5DC|nr:PREDICTED: spectrin beta chain, non-erythrocytic 5-like [Calidris pugnax]